MFLRDRPKFKPSFNYSHRRDFIRQQVIAVVDCLESIHSDLMQNQEALAVPAPQATSEGPGNCRWTDRDLDLMMNFLYERRAERGEGTFKQPTLRACALHVNENGDRQGRPKDGTSVKGKFKSVRSIISLLIWCFPLTVGPPAPGLFLDERIACRHPCMGQQIRSPL